jgi:hypothetical protein
MKMLMQFDLGDCPICLHILSERVGVHYCFNFLRTHFGELLRDVPFNTRLDIWLLNTTVLHHITAVKWVNGFRRLSWTSDWSRTWRSCTLTWLQSSRFVCGGYFKTKAYATTVSTREALWRRFQQFSSELKNTPGIFERLRHFFSLWAELRVREHGGHLEQLL